MTSRFPAFRASLRCLLPALALAVSVIPAAAEKADRNKPLNVEADNGRYDDLKQIGTFTGNVVVTKGTLTMRAAQIEVRQSPEGYQYGLATALPGQLARFSQKREGVDETIQGEAERIEYDGKTDTVRFVNRAVIRRYRGATLADETAGNLITYDNAREVFSVSSGDSAATPGNPGGRVRATLTPRDAVPESAASAPAPAVLRPSPSIGTPAPGERR
jgi:lipopolysaccharide export system protein LptA